MNSYKHFFLLLCALCLLPVAGRGQDNKLDEFKFEDVPQENSSVPYFAVGGGFVGTFFFPKVDEINKIVEGVLPGKKIDAPVFLVGAQGFTGIPGINNIRAGFISVGGNAFQEGDIGTMKRRVEYSIGWNGISLDYGVILTRRLTLLPGAVLGWGKVGLNYSQSSGNRDFGGNFETNAQNYAQNYAASFWFVQPNLNIEYAFSPVSMFRVNAGYSVPLSMSDWKADNLSTISKMSDQITGSGLTVHFGLFVGLFGY